MPMDYSEIIQIFVFKGEMLFEVFREQPVRQLYFAKLPFSEFQREP